jgi:hypothetical protein
MKIVTIGKRMVSLEQIAYIEPFDATSNPEFKSDKAYKGRVVLLNRDTVLSEQTSAEFAAAHDLHLFVEDDVAVNRVIDFKIEIFEPSENFKPSRPYRTRLKWSDDQGSEQSKLLITAPELAIAGLLDAQLDVEQPKAKRAARPAKKRGASRRAETLRA